MRAAHRWFFFILILYKEKGLTYTAPQPNRHLLCKGCIVTLEPGMSSVRKQGNINKCPNCGGVLKAFSSICELCGHELSGVAANKTISDLVARFEAIETEVSQSGLQGSAREKEIIARKGRYIRDFAIPNSREDLQSLIFFISPKIQDNVKPDPNAEDWRVKFKEVMTLAKNAYRDDAKTRGEFEEIERSLNISLSDALQTRAKRNPLLVAGVVAVIGLAVAGLGFSQYNKSQRMQCEQQFREGAAAERARLNGVVTAVEAKRGEKKFTEAASLLNDLRWGYQAACQSDGSAQEIAFWEVKRKELLSAIQSTEAADKAQQAEIERQEQARKQEEINREQAERRAVAEQDAARKRAQVDREMEDSLSSRAKAAAVRKSW